MQEGVWRLTRDEWARLEVALDAEPRPVPELVALIRQVRESGFELISPHDGDAPR